MKRKINIILLAAATLVACQQEKFEEPAKSDFISFRITAVSPSENISIKWNAVSDRIGVFATESDTKTLLNENAYYDAFSSTVTSRFEPLRENFKINWEDQKNYDIALYYPFSTKITDPENVPYSIHGEQIYDIATEKTFVKDSSFFAAYLHNVKKSGTGILDVQLCPITSYIRLTLASKFPMTLTSVTIQGEEGTVLSFEDGNYNITDQTLNAGEKTSDRIIIRFKSPVTVTSTPVNIWAKVNPGYAGRTLTIIPEFADQDDPVQPIVINIEEGGLKPGSGEECIFSISAEATDLCTVGTANTYIISKANTLYSFNATVKGNGNSKPATWTFEGEPQSFDFQTEINPAEAGLLWYSTPMNADGTYSHESPVAPESVTFDAEEGKVYFKTPKNFVNGNAVIAVFDTNGNILWSWNIWAVKDWDPDATSRQAGRYTFMDRNLGAIIGAEAKDITDNIKAASAIGNYYQWGRKDPFPAASKYSGSNAIIDESTWGNEAYTTIDAYKVSGDKIFGDRTQSGYMLGRELGSRYTLEQAVEQSVRHPHKWMFGDRDDSCYPQYSWFNGSGDYEAEEEEEKARWRALWGSMDNISNEKTIYDPCPAGWKVPTGDAYPQVIESVRLSSGKHGVYSSLYDLYFPYAGQRKAGFGGSALSGSSVILMSTATVTNSSFPLRADIAANEISSTGAGLTSSNSYAGAGYQIRCVREEVAVSATPYGYQNGHPAALMGDSITRTWRDRGRLEFFTENNYLNFGADGTTTNNMIGRFCNSVLKDDPVVTVITGGTNDIASNDGYFESREEIVNNLHFMGRLAADKGSVVILGSIAPSRDMWWKDDEWKVKYPAQWIADKVVATNSMIKAIAEKYFFAYADYWSVLRDEQNGLDPKYQFNGTDAVHPNYDGFLQMESILTPLITNAMYDPSATIPRGGEIDDMDRWEW